MSHIRKVLQRLQPIRECEVAAYFSPEYPTNAIILSIAVGKATMKEILYLQ